MTPDEFSILMDAIKESRKENRDDHDKINDHLSTLNGKVLKHELAIESQCKEIQQIKTFKGWLLKNLWWLIISIVLGLLGSGGALWQFIEGWTKRNMPG